MWVPDRKIMASGLAGILAWAVMQALAFSGHPMPAEAQALLVTLITTAMGYIVPPSQRDIVKRLNDELVAVAAADPTIPVSSGAIVRNGTGK